MLLRPGGGLTGIKEYLQRGHKQGRSHSRGELDERLVLAGDLDVTNAIILSVNSTSENYKHFTLSFKEDSIDRATLLAIAQEFEAFAFAAYKSGEYNFYAEAHIPRIKSYTNSLDGELVERKPHIHIVIPKLNLLSGHILNPLGMTDQNVNFIDAWQEHINAKYGLASPKDNRRVAFTDESTVISRHKGDVFGGQGSRLKTDILNALLDRRIDCYEDFLAMLAEFGETRTRNAGMTTEYPNIKVCSAARGVNLKDYVFSRAFVKLSHAEKHQRLNAEHPIRYEATGVPRSTPQQQLDTLAYWRDFRAKEIKYLNSGNKADYAYYRAANAEVRRSLLAERELRFYGKHPPTQMQHVRVLRDALHHVDHHEQVAESVEALVRDCADTGARKSTEPTHCSDSVAAQFARDLEARTDARKDASLDEFKAIRAQLDARVLLKELSASHGVLLEKHTITKARDGSDRIQCGTRNLNVSDFLTKEMNLPWAEAAQILRDCFTRQLECPAQAAQPSPTQWLWRDFQSHYKANATPELRKTQRQERWDAQRRSEQARQTAIRAEFYRVRGRIHLDGLTSAQRRAGVSVARMERIEREAALRENIQAERKQLAQVRQSPMRDLYRAWLLVQAQAGDERARAELRRMRVRLLDEEEQASHANSIAAASAAAQAEAESAIILQASMLQHRIDHQGNVTYQRYGSDVLRDMGHKVDVLQQDRQSIELALRLAVQKFGNPLRLHGSADFQEKAVRIAADAGLKLEFTDSRLNQLYRERRAHLADKAALKIVHLQSKPENPIAVNLPTPEIAAVTELVILSEAEAAPNVVVKLELESGAMAPVERPDPKELERAQRAFKNHALGRESKAFCYKDDSKLWLAFPEALRQDIEAYVALPKDDRAVALERQRECLKCDPQALELLNHLLVQTKTAGKDIER